MAGTVGAIFNGALQVGSAVGLAIGTSIQISIDAKTGESEDIKQTFKGRAASFWFVLAVVGVEIIAVAALYRAKHAEPVEGARKESDTVSIEEKA
jgi:hypothetical protein